MEDKNLEFMWGKKITGGDRNREVQYFQSFTYDGVDYTLYDNVYLYKEGESFPYVGKLIKIWENPDKSKQVEVLWYFHPCEISNYVMVELTNPKEVFLACGEGVGLTNTNFVEALAGKCDLVCISKDSRNPQPSAEQIQKAKYVFCRFFDVGECIVLDNIDEKITEVDVKFIFNQVASEKPRSISMEEQKTMVGEKLYANYRQENAAICETASSLKVQEVTDLKVSSVELNFSHGEKVISGVSTESDGLKYTNCRLENTSGEKISLSFKIKENADLKVSLANQENISEENIDGVGRSFVNLKFTKNSEIDDRLPKKAKHDSSLKVSNDNNNNSKPLMANISASEDKKRNATDPVGTAENSSKKLKVDQIKNPVNGKLTKEPCKLLSAFTSRPNFDRSKWFAELPWEERLQEARECGKLVIFQNLDPAFTSAEVEDIVYEVFKETCKAKMLQKTAYSSPHSGQAFVIFKTSKVAEHMVTELDERCLLLPNGRPLFASIANPCLPKKQSTFAGHLILDKIKSNREMKEAVSTSHSSQPNTLEYNMAVEWCLLVENWDLIWKRLYKRQWEELQKLKAYFKSEISTKFVVP